MLLGRPKRQRRIAQEPLLLDQKAEEALQRRRRPGLARGGRASCSARRRGTRADASPSPRRGSRSLQRAGKPDTPKRPARRRASHRGKPPLRSAKAQEIVKFLAHVLVHSSSFGQPPGPRWGEPWAYPAYRPATGKPLETGFFYGPDTPATRRAHPGAVGLRSPWYRPARSPDVAMRAVHEEAWRRIAARPASPTRSSVTAAPRSASGSC